MARRPDLGYFADGTDLLDPRTYEQATAPFGQARPLPAAAFQSLEFALLEDEAIWTRDWVCIGTEADIPEPGDLLPFTVGNHGIHVQRMPNGNLEGRFNNAQHGGCRFVPVQCQGGTKTRCSFTSCGYSRDRDAISAAEGGSNVPAMHQYLGLRPERLLRISVATLGPMILVNVDGAGRTLSTGADIEAMVAHALSGKPSRIGKRWLDVNGNWKLVAQALMASSQAPLADMSNAIATNGTTAGGEERSAFWLFPNVIILATASAACIVTLQQTALEKTLCRVQMWGSSSPVGPASPAAALLEDIEAASARAVAAQDRLRLSVSEQDPGTIQRDRTAYWAQRLLVARLMAMPRLDHQAPMYHSTRIYSI